MNTKLYLLTVGLLLSGLASAQSFRYQARVEPVKQPGYYQILLPADVVGQLNPSLTDIRLYDSSLREVPYLMTRHTPNQSPTLAEFERVSQITVASTTTLVLRNPHPATLRTMTLHVRNADVQKQAQLSGSADGLHWYALLDAIELHPTPAPNQTTSQLRIDIPTSDYRYYRLVIRGDSLSAPLNILRISYDSASRMAGEYSRIGRVTFTQRDSLDNHTYIRVTRPLPARFDKLKLDFAASGPFRRNALIGQLRTRHTRRGQTSQFLERVQAFTVSSASENIITLSDGLTTSNLCIVITNNDSPPLILSHVQGFQINTSLTANLRADTPYQLRFSAPDAVAPQYDLAYFRQHIPANLPKVPLIAIQAITTPALNQQGRQLPRWLIWPVLSLVLLLLGVFTYRMLTDIQPPNP